MIKGTLKMLGFDNELCCENEFGTAQHAMQIHQSGRKLERGGANRTKNQGQAGAAA
jgi:hypothetical protein